MPTDDQLWRKGVMKLFIGIGLMFRLSDYSKAALPVIFTAAAAAGALTSAGAKFAAVSLALDVLMSIAQKLVVPLVYAYLAVTVANGVFPNSLMAAAARFTKIA